MKLQSMVNYVLEQKERKDDLCYSLSCIYNYANFLKTPLTLGIFIPTNEDGPFLNEPKIEDYFDDGFNLEFNQKYFKEEILVEYNKAKENVIFDGIKYAELKNDRITIEYIGGWLYEFYICDTIEDLLVEIDNLVITQNAVLKFGI